MKLHLSVLGLLLAFTSWGQLDADKQFEEARKLTAEGKYQEARQLLRPAMREYPQYYDLFNFVGKTHAWEGNYDSAYHYLSNIILEAPDYLPAYLGYGDVLIWEKKYSEVISQMDEAEKRVDSNEVSYQEIHTRRAFALFKLREFRTAVDELTNIDTPEANSVRQNALRRLVNHSVDVIGSVETFSEQYETMYYGTVQVGQSTKYGVGIARVNMANRFNETGYQGQIDLYPLITDRIYGYLNYGYSSNTAVFPEHRFGVELYGDVGNGFEISAGMRHLYFGPQSTVTMYTGSVNYYTGKYLFSFRPFITPQDDGTDFTGNFFARRFLKDSRSWVTLRGNYGFSPDARRIQVGAGEVIEILQTAQIGAEWQQAISQNWMFILDFTYTYQELPFDPGNFYSIYAPTIGIKRLL